MNDKLSAYAKEVGVDVLTVDTLINSHKLYVKAYSEALGYMPMRKLLDLVKELG